MRLPKKAAERFAVVMGQLSYARGEQTPFNSLENKRQFVDGDKLFNYVAGALLPYLSSSAVLINF